MKEPKKTPKNKQSKKKITPVVTTSTESLSADDKKDYSLASPEQLNVDKLLAQALVRYKNDGALNDKKEKLKEVSYLGTIVEEYLSCFTLIGYTIEGEKTCIFNAKTSKDEAALVDLLRATFIEIVSNRP